MQRLLPIICVVAGLAAGAVTGLFIWSPESSAPRPVGEAPEKSDTVPQPLPRAEPVQRDEQTPSMGTLLAGIEAPRASGDGAIEGVVKYDEGGPVAGVEIRATPLLPAPDDDAAGDRLEAFARRRVAERALQVVAQTGADGEYRFVGLDSDKLYSLTPSLPSHGFRPESGIGIKHYRAGTRVGFIATRRLSLRLEFPDGREPDWAYVEVVPDGKEDRSLNRSWNWTFDEPFIPVRPGRWKITAKAGDWQQFAGEVVWDTAESAGAELSIDLKQRVGIMGTVVPLPGAVEQLRLVMVREEGGTFPVVDRPHGVVGHSWTSVFNIYLGLNFGYFDLEPGRYRLCLFHGDRLALTHDQTVAGDLSTLRLGVPPPDVKDFIVVRVSGPDGPVKEGVTLNLIYANANGSEGGGAISLDRGNGEYWLPRNDARLRQPGGFYQVGVRTIFGGRTLRYEPTDTHVLDVVFAAPATLVVEIVGFESFTSKEELRVRCVAIDLPQRGHAFGDDQDDRAVLGAIRRYAPLIPGKYEVTLTLGRPRSGNEIVLDRKDVDAASGDNSVQLTAPVLHSLTVAIPEEYRKQQLSMQLVDRSSPAVHQSRTGVEEYVFENLKPGEYRLQANPAGVMNVNIPAVAGQRVTFAPLPFNACRLEVANRNAAVDVGLVDGDIVVEIDGAPLADHYARRFELSEASRAKESTTWVVLREGRRVTITFDGRKFGLTGLMLMPARAE